MKKWMRSALALLLVLGLAVGLLPMAVFADGGTKKKYVSLGDSMTNGLGLLDGYNSTNSSGYNEVSLSAYPNRVATHFGWELTQLATSGTRVEDVRYLLEYGRENAFQDDGWADKKLNHPHFWNSEAAGGIPKVAATYQKAVREADVISMCLGNANFAIYLSDMIWDVFGQGEFGIDYSNATLENGIQDLDPQLKDLILGAFEQVLAYLSTAIPEDTARKIANRAGYALARYLQNYSVVLDLITEVNPDVEIMIVGLINSASGYEMDLTYQGRTYHLEMAQLQDLLLIPANTYLAALPTLKQAQGKCSEATFYYAQIERMKPLGATLYEVFQEDPDFFRSRFITDLVGNVFPMLNMDLVEISLDDLHAYEKAYAAGPEALAAYVAVAGVQKAASAAVYLALEASLLHSLGMIPCIDVDKIMASQEGEFDLMKYVGSLVAGTYDAYESNAQAAMEKCFADDLFFKGLYLVNPDTAKQLARLYVTTDSLQSALNEDGTVVAFLNVYAQMNLSNGINSHPNKEGHADLADRVITAYESGNTTQKEVENRIQKAMDFLTEVLSRVSVQELKDGYTFVAEEEGLNELAEELVNALDLGDTALAQPITGVAQSITQMVQSVGSTYLGATTQEYRPGEDSLYVAIGDASAYGDSYVAALAEKLDVKYKNLAKEKKTIDDAFAIVEKNKETVAKADLITLGFTSNSFINAAIDQAMNSGSAKLDWTALLGEEYALQVTDVLDMLNAELEKSMPNEQLSQMVGAAVEGYAYSCVSYICNLPELMNEIRTINPDAVVVVVGMYNPLKDLTVALDEATVLNIGEYLDYLTLATSVHGLACALCTSQGIYVDAPTVETVYEAEGGEAAIAMEKLAMDYLRKWGESFLPSEAGHAYIAEQIFAALSVHTWVGATCTDPKTCSVCGVTEGAALGHTWVDATCTAPKTCSVCKVTEGEPLAHSYENGKCTVCGAVDENYKPVQKVLYGDANGDGAVNAKDAMLVLQYYTKKITEDKLDLTACDVDGNGTVNAKDAMLILQKYTKKIEGFPVEAA